ncbi:MAG TPA: hypothetical protein DCM07_33245 [Planctomycetaceae bacterium]|nr:hypothetical protein [Planctomycetaceae bacterium]
MHQTQPICLHNIIPPHGKFSIIGKSCHRGARHLQDIADHMQMFAQTFNQNHRFQNFARNNHEG